jgi:hypothetical protein
MQCFTFELRSALQASDILLALASGGKTVPFVVLYDIPYIIVPRAARFIPSYRDEIFKGTTFSGRTNVLYKDYNIYNFVKVISANINFLSEAKGKVRIELLANTDKTFHSIGTLGLYTLSELVRDSNSILEMLPYNLKKKTGIYLVDSENWLKFSSASYRIISSLIVTFTTIYALLNIGNKIKVGGGMYGEDSIEYVNYLAGKLRELGDDFYKVIEKLRAFSTVMAL